MMSGLAAHSVAMGRESRVGRQRILFDGISAIAGCADMETVWEETTHHLKWVLDFSRVDVAELGADGMTYSLTTIYEERPECPVDSWAAIPLDAGAAGSLLKGGVPYVVYQVPAATPSRIVDSALEGGSLPSLLGVLVQRDGMLVGALLFGSTKPGAYDETDVEILGPLADHIAAAWVRVRRLQQLSGLVEDLRRQRVEAGEALRTAESASLMKDEFLATLSHELRTPLNAILGWSRILLEGHFDGAHWQGAVRSIERSAKIQAQLIEDLLDVSRIAAGQLRLDRRPISLAPVIEAAADAVRAAAADKNIQLVLLLDDALLDLYGDARRLQQIVWNLLANAINFTPKGGRVEVRVRQGDSSCEIEVSDTGRGFSETFAPNLFTLFRQADSEGHSASGLGIGLALVRRLVEAHGGTVQAESPGPGLGATFTITLPLRAEAHTAPASDGHAVN